MNLVGTMMAACLWMAALPASGAAAGPARGPTVRLDYGGQALPNPIGTFLYFVHLISPTPTHALTSEGNTQRARIASYERRDRGRTFRVVCDLEVAGAGFHEHVLDFDAMVARRRRALDAGKPARRLLQYIRLEGAGQGRVEITGRLEDARPVVDRVIIRFTRGRAKSPVTVGLADLEQGADGTVCRVNELTARVNAMEFNRTEHHPRAGISLASVRGAGDPENLWASVKGTLANLVVDSIGIRPEGQAAMLDFGRALADKALSFTFPAAVLAPDAAGEDSP